MKWVHSQYYKKTDKAAFKGDRLRQKHAFIISQNKLSSHAGNITIKFAYTT